MLLITNAKTSLMKTFHDIAPWRDYAIGRLTNGCPSSNGTWDYFEVRETTNSLLDYMIRNPKDAHLVMNALEKAADNINKTSGLHGAAGYLIDASLYLSSKAERFYDFDQAHSALSEKFIEVLNKADFDDSTDNKHFLSGIVYDVEKGRRSHITNHTMMDGICNALLNVCNKSSLDPQMEMYFLQFVKDHSSRSDFEDVIHSRSEKLAGQFQNGNRKLEYHKAQVLALETQSYNCG
jgi:hypothetical protein